MPPVRLRSSGFTLIEVLITIVVVSILVGVALPSYRDYVRRGQIPDGLTALADLRVKMETYYQDYRNYGDTSCAENSKANWAKFTAPAGARFTYECKLDGKQAYTLKVIGKTGQATVGHTYTLDQDNTRKTLVFKGSDLGAGKECWLVRGDEC